MAQQFADLRGALQWPGEHGARPRCRDVAKHKSKPDVASCGLRCHERGQTTRQTLTMRAVAPGLTEVHRYAREAERDVEPAQLPFFVRSQRTSAGLVRLRRVPSDDGDPESSIARISLGCARVEGGRDARPWQQSDARRRHAFDTGQPAGRKGAASNGTRDEHSSADVLPLRGRLERAREPVRVQASDLAPCANVRVSRAPRKAREPSSITS